MTRAANAGEGGTLVNIDYRAPLKAAFLVFVPLFGLLVGWMAVVPLAGAVIAPGHVVVRGKPQLVQHLDGGIVKRIEVRNGDRVEKGSILIRLDESLLTANLTIYRNRLREALAKQARLEAEREDKDAISFSNPLYQAFAIADDESHRQRQETLLLTRRASRAGEVEKLKEKISQFENQRKGLEGLIAAKTEQLRTVETELKGLQDLLKKGVATKSRVFSQERMKAEISGQLAEHSAELARVSDAIRETEVSIIQIDRAFKEKVLAELSETAIQIDDLAQQITATQKQLERVDIRAPVSGIVHELNVNTVGGTVPPNATLMQIIASEGGVDVEVSVEPRSIDQIAIGKEAVLRFSAFDHATTPEIVGRVERISPTSVFDEKSGLSFYRVVIAVTGDELARLGELQLIPGMPVEAFVRLGDRTLASFLMKPLLDNVQRVMRE